MRIEDRTFNIQHRSEDDGGPCSVMAVDARYGKITGRDACATRDGARPSRDSDSSVEKDRTSESDEGERFLGFRFLRVCLDWRRGKRSFMLLPIGGLDTAGISWPYNMMSKACCASRKE